MTKNLRKKFFKQNGRPLNQDIPDTTINTLFPREALSTLANIKPTEKELRLQKLGFALKHVVASMSARNIKKHTRWVAASFATSILLSIVMFKIPLHKQAQAAPKKYNVFSSKPLTLESFEHELTFRDSRAVKIEATFKYFKCPLSGLGTKFVEQADINEIPYWVVASIAFQESSCGKNTPTVDGLESYNAWGWATYGDQVYSFNSWEQGIEVVSKYMSKKFYSKGVTDLCEIMKTYTPPSNGSWCSGVQYFGDFIRNFKTPEE